MQEEDKVRLTKLISHIRSSIPGQLLLTLYAGTCRMYFWACLVSGLGEKSWCLWARRRQFYRVRGDLSL